MTIPCNPLLKPLLGTPINKAIAHSLGLIGYWVMNEKGGLTVLDLSGNKKPGTLTNGPTWDVGKCGSAIRMSGSEVTEDHIDIGDHSLYEFGDASIDKPFTFIVGYTPDSAIVDHPLVIKWDNTAATKCEYAFSLAPDSGLEPRFQLLDNTTADRLRAYGTPIANPTEFHQFAATYDGSAAFAGINLYVDGIAQTLSDESQGSYVAMHTGGSHLRFGALLYEHETYDTFADGRFEYVMICNRTLTVSQIARLYREPFYIFKDSGYEALLGSYVGVPAGVPILRRRRECA